MLAPSSLPAIALALVALGLGALWWRARARLAASERESARTSEELSRRLSELFSLQELSYVLADSLELDRTVEQVVHYAMRFLDARGALLALAGAEEVEPLTVAAALGTLAQLKGQKIPRDDRGLVARSVGREQLELIRNSGGSPTALAPSFSAAAAAAVPLRAHGVAVGTLVVADPKSGVFQPEDVRLLSTVATHTAVVLANARFFELVRHAKEQWETAFDALSEGMALVDERGEIRRANRALAGLLRLPLERVLGTPLAPHLSDRSPALADLFEAARRGDSPPPLVFRSDLLDRTVRVNAARMRDPAAGRSVVVLVEDVTEQHALEAQLIQSEKLAAVGQLVSGVAHELNNPLTSIAGLSEFLLEQKELGKGDRGHLKVINEQAERAGRIVRNLLTFARKGSAEETRVDLNDVVQRTLLLMAYELKLREVDVDRDLATLLPEVLGDRHALQQVVLNLLTNAAQAVQQNPPGRLRRVSLRTWFDGQIHLRVHDTGPGIPDQVLSHLFTPFFTTKEPGKGTGLGLSITYSIVQSHGGQITVERPPEGGAAFRVDLPPARADAPAGTPLASEPPHAPPAEKRSILLVDDDPAVRRLVRALFAREGHTVEVARNGQHALELAGAKAYDLILADARAAARGRLFVEELVEKLPEVKARTLVATGDVRPATEETLGRLGLRYVRKPFNLRDLRDEAARLWAGTPL